MQTPSSSQRVHELFDKALELPPDERPAFLDRACADETAVRREVDSLLAAHEQAEQFLADPTIETSRLSAGEGLSAGERIGSFTLLRPLGEGGYGIVYLAEEDPPLRRRVALKVIRAGMDTRQVVKRFELEQQALALLDHPNISKVLSAGETAAGRPYFVMELVDGEPITSFCRDHKLDLDARLRLFRQVCSAVEHAHRRGILHRDIKPGNVLVTIQDRRPVPKVIDFGIAKALHADRESDLKSAITIEPQFLGTPQYMSPEQADPVNSHVDSRSDVYSLGALLYELIADAPPFDPSLFSSAVYGEIGRILRQTPARPPSTLPREGANDDVWSAQVRGDLDRIVLKALAKEPDQRYGSAEELAGDVKRYLRREPVTAQTPGLMYRTRTFAARHRWTLLLALVALCCGMIGWMLASSGRQVAPVITIKQSMVTEQPLSPGLVASFYSVAFEKLIVQRIDPAVNFHWSNNVPPATGVPTPRYAARWSGVIVVPPGGVRGIGFNVDDGGRLRLDGQLLAETHEPARKLSHAEIDAGRHSIEIEYWNRYSLGEIRLFWLLPDGSMPMIPASALFHAETPASQPSR